MGTITSADMPKGARVMATEKAFEWGLWARSEKPVYGIVATESRRPLRIAVIREGRKTVEYYHVDFWRPTEEA